MNEPMYLGTSGDGLGNVAVWCDRADCAIAYEPDGPRLWRWREYLPERATRGAIDAVWDAHLATHPMNQTAD